MDEVMRIYNKEFSIPRLERTRGYICILLLDRIGFY